MIKKQILDNRKMNRLKNTGTKGLMLLAIIVGIGFLASCKKDDEPGNTTKTLTKSKLYDKTWYNQGSTVSIHINSNGTIGSNVQDKWSWVNNSDTLLLDYKVGSDRIWIAEWTEDTEASLRLKGSTAGTLFKDAKW